MEVEFLAMKNFKNSKENVEWLFFLVIYVAVVAVTYILKLVFHIKYDNSIYRLVIPSILVIGTIGYFLYLWRVDLSGFFKRIFIAAPFALLFSIFMIILTKTLIAACFALPVFFFLLYKTPNWKQHFSITLILASILVVALRFSHAIIKNQYNSREISILGAFLFAASVIFIGFSYGLYIRNLQYGETIELHNIFIRILKFTSIFALYYAVFLFLVYFRMRNFISFPIGLSLCFILSIIFIVIVYRFDLMPIKRK